MPKTVFCDVIYIIRIHARIPNYRNPFKLQTRRSIINTYNYTYLLHSIMRRRSMKNERQVSKLKKKTKIYVALRWIFILHGENTFGAIQFEIFVFIKIQFVRNTSKLIQLIHIATFFRYMSGVFLTFPGEKETALPLMWAPQATEIMKLQIFVRPWFPADNKLK